MMILLRQFQHVMNHVSWQKRGVVNTTRSLSLLVLLTFVTACSSKTPSKVFDQAVAAFDEEEYTPALDLSEKAYRLQKEPKNHGELSEEAVTANTIKFSCFYAICLIKNGKANEALRVLEELVDKHPENSKVLKLYGESLYNAKKYTQAFSILKDAYKLDSNDKDTLKLICSCAVKEFSSEDKSYIRELVTYLKAPKSPIAKLELAVLYNNIGVWYSLNKDLRLAEKYYFSQPVALRSQLPQVKLNRAITYDKRAKRYAKYNKKAKLLYNYYLKADPDNVLGVGEDTRARMKTLEGR